MKYSHNKMCFLHTSSYQLCWRIIWYQDNLICSHKTFFFLIVGYAFNVTNPEEGVAGMKPIVKEVGPFVYKAVTVKDSRDNLKFNDDSETLTYRPR